MDINATIDDVVKREGGYVNDPKDAGGETNFGITIKVARANGYAGAMRDMPRAFAVEVYKRQYWTGPAFDRVAVIFPTLGEKLLDIGVNMGPDFAARSLQRCLTVLNDQGRLYPDLKPDGAIGNVTLAALRSYLAARAGDMGRRTLLFMVAAMQSVRYVELAEANPNNEKFMQGWQFNRGLYNALP